MSLSSRGKKQGSPQREQPSKVLLVCVFDTLVIEITNSMIYQKFRKFGNIIRLLIFDKAEVTKFFIEYSQVEQAIKAKKQLEGTKLLQAICKMNIYFSNFSNVDLKNETSEGADYSFEEQLKQNFVQKYDLLTKSSPEEDADVFNDLIMQSFDVLSPFSRSKTDNPIHLAKQIDLWKDEKMGEDSDFDFQIKSNIQSILNSNSNSGKSEKLQGNSGKETNSLSLLNSRQNSIGNNTLIYFDFVNYLEIRQVYNLFSNFGNIAGISKKKFVVYIKFRTTEFAAISYSYLNGHILIGNAMKLKYAEKVEDFLPKENEFCELVYFDSSFDRFTSTKSITINSPSKTLHVSSLKKQICRQKTLKDIFNDYGEVQNIHILKQSADKNMALVKFYHFEDCFRALAQLHNSTFSGRKMQISFTKSRI